ncbi:unnamed protein product [Sphagnum jensenii]|uniref:Uncharacterized protein n=1 Tax=Sphagnum jensenii TaxID=128206 RepID=A0ABP1AEX9_9BRYO
MVNPFGATQQRLTPTLSQDSLERTSCTLNEEKQAGCSSISRRFSGIGSSSSSSAGSGSSASDDCHSSRVIWVAGINGGTDKDHAHAGLKHIFEQIVGPGDHIFALVLFDNIPSELGITFAFTRDGFRSTAERKMLKWLSEKLDLWRGYLQNLGVHCREKNVTLELRVCAAHSLGETAVREAQFLQATDIILDRNDGSDSTTRKIAKLLSEKTEARVGLMQKRQTSNKLEKLEAVLQVPENRQPHDFGSHEPTLSLDKQTLISRMLNGLRVVCRESEDPYYLSISIDLLSGI